MNLSVKKSFLIISGIFLLNGVVFAGHPLTTDDAGIVEKDKSELEISYDINRIKTDGEKIRERNAGLSFTHGISDKINIGISIPYQVEPDTREEVGNAEITFKFSLIPDKLAVSMSNELSSSDYFVNLISSQKFYSFLMHFNAGFQKTEEEGFSGGYGVYNFALEHPIIEKLNWVAEINYTDYGFRTWLSGFQYEIENYFTLSTGFSKADNGDESYLFGLVKEF